MSTILPAGHAHTITNKAYATEPMSDLEKAFLEFRARTSKIKSYNVHTMGFSLVGGLLHNIEISICELHSLALKHEGYPAKLDGVFVSMGYARCPETIILSDFQTPLNFLGLRLPHNKLLVNKGIAGNWLGAHAHGVVVNCGEAQDFAGYISDGVIVNGKYAGRGFGTCGTGGVAISLREPAGYWSPSIGGRTICHDRLSEGMREYLEELVSACNGSPEYIRKRYGDDPAHRIKKDIWAEEDL